MLVYQRVRYWSILDSLDWFKGNLKPDFTIIISLEKPWFPVDFPLSQSNDRWVETSPLVFWYQ